MTIRPGRALQTILTAAGALAAALPLLAGVNRWSSSLPDGAGEVLALVSHPAQPSRLFAGSWMAGVFRSLDGGRSWSDVSGSISPYVTALAVEPADPDTIYAATFSEGQVWRSATAGTTWTKLGAPGFPVAALALKPGDPATLLAATWGGDGVFLSSDRGETWTATGSELGNFWGYCIAWPSGPGGTVYIGGTGGVFRSPDGGSTWLPAYNGLPGGKEVVALVIDPVQPSTMYASVIDRGVYRTGNGGESWALLTAGLPEGTYWALALDPVDHDTVYAASDGAGVFRSTDGGGTWTSANQGLRRLHARCLAVSVPTFRRVWVGTGAGVFELAEDGQLWEDRNGGLANAIGVGVAVAPSDPDVVYAGCAAGGVFRSDDGGGSWTLSSGDALPPFVGPVAVDPTEPDRAVTGVNMQALTFSPTYVPFYRTADGGASWRGSEIDQLVYFVNDVAFDPTDPAKVWVCAGNKYLPVARSINGGETWQSARTGLPEGAVGYSISIDAVNPNNMYAAMSGQNGVYKTNNFALYWLRRNEGLGSSDVRVVRSAPGAPEVVYAGTYGHGVFRSTNGADTWRATGALPEGGARAVWSLAIDPASADRVWAGTSAGVFTSEDGGASWAPLGAGLPAGRPVWSLALDPRTRRLHAAVVGGKGVYTYAPSAFPGISLAPDSSVLAIGDSTSLTVALYPAQAAETVVFITVDPPSARGTTVDVAASIVVPALADSVQLPVRGRSLAAPVTVRVSLPAELGGDSAVARLVVAPRPPRGRIPPR